MVERAEKGDARNKNRGDQDSPAADEKSVNKDPAERAGAASSSGAPRWRQIEIMHERSQLRKLLDDFDLNFEELEVEVFGSEAEHQVFYRHLGEFDEEEIEIEDGDEDDDYEDEDYDDLEE